MGTQKKKKDVQYIPGAADDGLPADAFLGGEDAAPCGFSDSYGLGLRGYTEIGNLV